jgi:hypothetical protein
MFKKNRIMKYRVYDPCVQGYRIRDFETKEEAKKCLARLKEKPRIEKID